MAIDLPNPEYLGDAVYCQIDCFGMIILTTGSHNLHEAQNIISLEPRVYQNLVTYLKKIKERAKDNP